VNQDDIDFFLFFFWIMLLHVGNTHDEYHGGITIIWDSKILSNLARCRSNWNIRNRRTIHFQWNIL